jgi:hypothetical membrane protein
LFADPLRRAGALFFVAAAQFIVLLSVAQFIYPGYSVATQPISDLGVMQPSSFVFNSSVFALGALAIIGAFFIYISRSRLIGGLTALSAWGAMGVGIFPENTGDLHIAVSFVAFFFGGVAAIASYRMLRPPMSYFAIVLGAVTVAALVLYASGTYLGLGQGGMERLVAYPVLIWVLAFGAHLMGRRLEREPLAVPL